MGYNKVYETRSFCRIDSFEKKEKKGEGKMKDFFEDLGKRLGETAETVTNKASEAIEIQRLKSKVRGLARENAVDLMEMGRMIYENYKEGGEVGEEAEQDFLHEVLRVLVGARAEEGKAVEAVLLAADEFLQLAAAVGTKR